MSSSPSNPQEPNEYVRLPRQEYLNMASLVQDLRSRIAELETRPKNPPTMSPVLPHREPTMSDPEYFDGKRSAVRNFISQCRIVFTAQPSRFPTERHMVIYAASYLRDAAFSWFQPHLDTLEHEHPDHILDSFRAFANALRETFGDPDQERTAENKLGSLRQSNSVAVYSSEFKRLSLDTNWNDAALRFQFYRGLKDSLKDELAKTPRPESLDTLIDLCIRLDNRLHDRRLERQTPYQHAQHGSFSRFAPSSTTPENSQSFARSPAIRQSDQAPQRGPAMLHTSSNRMEIDSATLRRGPLHEDDKLRRRRLGLCLYCGQHGHQANVCAARPQGNISATTPHPQASTLVGPTSKKGRGQAL